MITLSKREFNKEGKVVKEHLREFEDESGCDSSFVVDLEYFYRDTLLMERFKRVDDERERTIYHYDEAIPGNPLTSKTVYTFSGRRDTSSRRGQHLEYRFEYNGTQISKEICWYFLAFPKYDSSLNKATFFEYDAKGRTTKEIVVHYFKPSVTDTTIYETQYDRNIVTRLFNTGHEIRSWDSTFLDIAGREIARKIVHKHPWIPDYTVKNFYDKQGRLRRRITECGEKFGSKQRRRTTIVYQY